MWLFKNIYFIRVIVVLILSLLLSSCSGSSNDSSSGETPLKQDVNLSIAYEYDNLNRVTKAEYSDGKVVIYVYDQAGNIIEKRVE